MSDVQQMGRDSALHSGPRDEKRSTLPVEPSTPHATKGAT